MNDELTTICGDAFERLRELPDESVQCCVTSPPYWGLRDYGTAAWEVGVNGCDHAVRENPRIESSTLGGGKESTGHQREGFKSDCPRCGARRIDSQLGLEKTPEEYVAKMVAVFREVRRVLRRDGTLWLNMGDSYASGELGRHDRSNGYEGEFQRATRQGDRQNAKLQTGLKPKDLCGIPWRVAFALQADGWWLRSDVIWAKPNPMPESVTDRPTKSHEYLFLLTKSASYFYDAEAIREPHTTPIELQIERVKAAKRQKSGRIQNSDAQTNALEKWSILKDDDNMINPAGRNKRSVWTVATAPYPEAHFATYPPDLIKPCIMAGTSAKGCCASCGAPWERVVERGEKFSTDGSRRMQPQYDDTGLVRAQGKWNNGKKPMEDHMAYEYKTLGWQPTCECDAGIEPCTILDCFAGSGTTGEVALELGRKAVLIELNPKYVALIEQRCNVTLGLALA